MVWRQEGRSHEKIQKEDQSRRVLRLPDLDYAKGAVLNTLGSPASKRAYEFAINGLRRVVLL